MNPQELRQIIREELVENNKHLMVEMDQRMDVRFGEMNERINLRFGEMETQFSVVFKKLDEHDKEFKVIHHLLRIMNEKFEALSELMAQFRDEVLTREDATIRELRRINDEKDFLGVRVTRVEERLTILEARS